MPRFQWLEAYELTFFQSLVDSIHDGLRPESLLKPEAWRRAMKALQDTHDITITKSQLANKYDNTKKKFRVWRALREEPGFGYDLATGCVTAPDQVWDAYLEKHPEARQFRGRRLEHEALFNELFLVVASGRYAQDLQNYHSTNHMRETTEVIEDGNFDTLLEDPSIESGTSRLSPVDGLATRVLSEVPSVGRRRVAPELPLPPRKKESDAELLADGLRRIAEAVAPSPSWQERAFDLLWKDFAEEGLDSQLAAAEALRDETTAISFCKMPPEVRKRWIDRLRHI